MKSMISVVVMAVLVAGSLQLATPAAQAAGTCVGGLRGFGATCTVSDVVGGSSSGAGGGGSSSGVPKYPACPQGKQNDSVDLQPWVFAPAGTPEADPKNWVSYKCQWGPAVYTTWVAKAAPVDPRVQAYALLKKMTLDPIRLRTTPLKPQDSGNPMVFVGMKTWLWAQNPDAATWGPASISAGGVSLTAKVTRVVWDMGDGQQMTCDGPGVAYETWMDPLKPPGDACVYVYQKSVADVTITATSDWSARWSGYGQSGTISFTTSATKLVDVAEVQVVVTG